jgi:large subunit ribosomal protein L23
MTTPHNIIKAILRTEKVTTNYPEGKYLFLVDKASNKIQIKKAVEELYKVKVKNINVFISCGKLRKVRYQLGKTPDLKKAVVTLKKGEKIDTT